ncbi:MAG: hypothetical protein AAGB13_09085 [Cyanobacteria bacterium P01_F01_bin.33]
MYWHELRGRSPQKPQRDRQLAIAFGTCNRALDLVQQAIEIKLDRRTLSRMALK